MDKFHQHLVKEITIKNFFSSMREVFSNKESFQEAYVNYAREIYLQKEYYTKLL
jgi:hypothetical protein